MMKQKNKMYEKGKGLELTPQEKKDAKELFDLDPKKKKKYPLMGMGKKGQTGGGYLIAGLILLVIAVITFISLTPAMSSVLDGPRGCSYFNCAGYIDGDATTATCSATNQTYTTARETKGLSCTVTDIFLPLLLLAALGGFVSLLLSGKLGRPEQPEFTGL